MAHDLIWTLFKTKNNKILILKRSLLKIAYTLPEIDVISGVDDLSSYMTNSYKNLIGLYPINSRLLLEGSPYGRRIEIFLCNEWGGKLDIKQEDTISCKWVSVQELYDLQNELSGYFYKLLNRIAFKMRH